ncbi:hypothetical protein PTT_03911 [Pyrenophora teres f. teres 0-1]|uniref:Uncharacterized protein n=1 Tax=Pyrenophora teres f. teres (strain 0-1) TaxID=861557 RepID=E3RE81_PYRTT|nr:hypothetical protein PTT_03911 [Pyrenophora teres f. teres 0-1]
MKNYLYVAIMLLSPAVSAWTHCYCDGDNQGIVDPTTEHIQEEPADTLNLYSIITRKELLVGHSLPAAGTKAAQL